MLIDFILRVIVFSTDFIEKSCEITGHLFKMKVVHNNFLCTFPCMFRNRGRPIIYLRFVLRLTSALCLYFQDLLSDCLAICHACTFLGSSQLTDFPLFRKVSSSEIRLTSDLTNNDLNLSLRMPSRPIHFVEFLQMHHSSEFLFQQLM